MLISDLIEDCRILMREHGNLEVVDDNNESIRVEFNHDSEDEDPVFVVT